MWNSGHNPMSTPFCCNEYSRYNCSSGLNSEIYDFSELTLDTTRATISHLFCKESIFFISSR
jgi:hypothetical protein